MTLRNRYHKIMDKVKVTLEMEERILHNISQTNLDSVEELPVGHRKKVITFPKVLSLAACLVVLVAGAFALRGVLGQGPVEPVVQPPFQVVSPEEYNSPEALCEAAGFPLLLPTALPEGMEARSYTLLADGTAEVIYSGGGNTLTYRMAKGEGDISGDYSEYPVVEETEIGGYPVTLQGDEGGFSLAVWMDGESTFALTSDEPVPKETLALVIQSLQPCG